MYFAPPSMPVIYQQYLMAWGVQEFSLEMIGTNVKRILEFKLYNTQDLLVGRYEFEYGETWRMLTERDDEFWIGENDSVWRGDPGKNAKCIEGEHADGFIRDWSYLIA
jgi:hypothetical protein